MYKLSATRFAFAQQYGDVSIILVEGLPQEEGGTFFGAQPLEHPEQSK